MIPNPNFVPNVDPATQAQNNVGVPATIPNPGIPVSMRACNNLQLACYYLRYQTRTSRPKLVDQITMANIRAIKSLRDWEQNHKDVDAPAIDDKDWPRTIEAIEEYFRGCLGTNSKIPLAYVIREEVFPPVNTAASPDPPTNYDSRQDELIARAPIHSIPRDATTLKTDHYLEDRVKVWELLSAITQEHDCWTYVKPAQRTRDGREAFRALKGHYLGANNVDNMASRAERKLTSTTYQGEKRRWTFEKLSKRMLTNTSFWKA